MTASTLHPAVPLHRYVMGSHWELSPTQLISPRPDGSVAYYQDTLSRAYHPTRTPPFDDEAARALCRYLTALVVIRGLQLVDGPYLQVLEDDGAIPAGWHRLRAVVWIDEYDVLVPVDTEAASG